jgi:excisionase family DNA binding protein
VWLTVAEVCAELQIARSTWEKWRQKGAAPKAVRLPSGKLRVRRDWLDAWLDDHVDDPLTVGS